MVLSITVALVDPDHARSTVTIRADVAVRDVTTSGCHLFWRTIKRNGTSVPFTARDGDTVSVESEPIDER
jgi:hypothetical protein